MEIVTIESIAHAFIRPREGANVGLIHTPRGKILIDTTSSPAEIQHLLTTAGVGTDEVRLVVNTHSHSDHTWGNQVFDCPILAQRLCREQMETNLKNDWSQSELQAFINQLEKTDPEKAREQRKVVQGLNIRLPDQLFERRCSGVMGGIRYQIIHMGGHTPDTSIAWLPEKRVLFASDLIFQGRYPFIFDADIPAWIGALNRLLEFEADTIIPGHGVRCGTAEIHTLIQYLEQTWQMAQEHIHKGHSADETVTDPAFPVFPGEKYERLHQANIRYMYEQQAG